jgi:phage/plasmid-associated DNA primase
MTVSQQHANLEFCIGFDAPIVKDPKACKQYDDIKTELPKLNRLYEITRPNKKCCVFMDIDGKANPKTTEEEFDDITDNIVEILRGFDTDFSIMNSSRYNHKTRNTKGEEETEHKWSFRITYKEYVDNILKMPKYIYETKYPIIKELLESEIEVYWGKKENGEKYDYIDIDPCVYRGKGGEGVGKMRCPNAFKGAKHQHNPINPYEVVRKNTIITGDLEDNLINFIKDDYEYIELGDEYIDNIEEPKTTPKTKNEKTEKKNVVVKTANSKQEQRVMNEEAPKRSQMEDFLMNYLGNNVVDWKIYFLVGSTLAHNGYDFNLFDEWCKLSDEYNTRCENGRDWNGWVRSRDFMNIGGLINLLKKNEEKYKEYKEKYYKKDEVKITIEMCEFNNELLTYLRPFLFENIRFSNGKWYVFKPHTCLWEQLPNIKIIIANYIHKLCDNEIKKIAKKIKEKKQTLNTDNDSDSDSDSEDEKENKQTNKEIKKLEKKKKKWNKTKQDIVKGISTLQSFLESMLLDNKFEDRLDKHIGCIAYRNGLYHIESGILKDICYDNYITKTLPFDYEKGNEEDKKYIKSQLLKICNMKPDILEYYLSILGYALTGFADRIQKFWVFFGANGSNGKSFILEILTKILQHYCCAGNTRMLENGSNKEHKYIPNVVKSRIAWFNELPKEKSTNNALIKQFRDGTAIKNEVLFGTERHLEINCKMFIVSNHKVRFGKDGGINRSIRQIGFNSTFIDKKKLQEDDIDNLQFVNDIDLKQRLIDMKHSFIELLCDYGADFIKTGYIKDEPKEITADTAELIKQNDKFYAWLDKHYTSDLGKYEPVDDIAELYSKDTGYYCNDPKGGRDYILSEMKRLSIYLFKKDKMKNKKRGCFEGIRRKTDYELHQELKGECVIECEEIDI